MAVLPLRQDLARSLEVMLRGRLPAARVFSLPPAWRAAEMFREDLVAAEIATTDSEGNVADFHALRHTIATLLSRGGVVPRVEQALLRHSDPWLTLGIYTHLGADDEVRALDVLPDFTSTETNNALRATGTDDLSGRPAGRLACHNETESDNEWHASVVARRTRRDLNPQPSVPKTDGGVPCRFDRSREPAECYGDAQHHTASGAWRQTWR
jgi:Phage integrase family